VSTLLRRPRQHGPLERLSEREQDVLALMAEGRSNVGIAGQIGLSERTVETYVRQIMHKLGLHDSQNDNRRVLAVLEYLRPEGH
jgi:DNA-binding NarL/FixJ family response regulator